MLVRRERTPEDKRNARDLRCGDRDCSPLKRSSEVRGRQAGWSATRERDFYPAGYVGVGQRRALLSFCTLKGVIHSATLTTSVRRKKKRIRMNAVGLLWNR